MAPPIRVQLPEYIRDALIQSIILGRREKFGSKIHVMRELCFALVHARSFQGDIEKIRAKHNIMTENPEAVFSGNAPKTVSIRKQTYSNPALDKDIRKLMATYRHIPSTLFPWVKATILSSVELLPWEQVMSDGDLFIAKLEHPEDAFKLPYTTKEKRTALNRARRLMDVKRIGAPTTDAKRDLDEISKILKAGGKSRFRGAVMTERARQIFLMKEAGKSWDEIVSDVYRHKGVTTSLTGRPIISLEKKKAAQLLYRRFSKRIRMLSKKVEK